MIPITIFFLLFTIFFPNRVVFVFDILILFMWYLDLTSSYALKRLNVKRGIVQDYLFIGEHTEIELIVKNNSIFPIYFLKIEDLLREEGGLFVNGRGEFFTSIPPYGEKRFIYKIEFRKRGVYTLKRINFISFGLFSFIKKEYMVDVPLKVVVYPDRFPIDLFPLSVRDLLPLMRTDYRLLEDLSYIDGVREYAHLDPIRRIHWKATAHTGKLLVKTYEYTATTTVHLFVDLNLNPEIFARKVWSGIRKRYEEYAIMAVASLIEYMLSKRIPLRLYILGEGSKAYIIENMNFADLMEHLSGIKGTDNPIYTLDDVMLYYIEKFTPSSTIILFSIYLTRSTLPLLIKIKSKVERVIVLVAPFGYSLPGNKRLDRSYDIFPQDIRALEEAASILRDEGIIVELVEPEDTISEVLSYV